MDDNKALGAAGAGQVVKALEREWTILPPTKRCLAQFQAWLESEARRKLVAAKEDVDDDTYAVMIDRTLEHIASGVYSWGRETAKAALRSPSGAIRFLGILLRQNHPHVDDEYVEKLVEAEPGAFQLALRSLMESTRPKSAGGNGEQPPTPKSP